MSIKLKELLNKWEFYALIAGIVFSMSITTRKYLFNLNYKFEEVFLITIITLAIIYTLYAIWIYKHYDNLFNYNNESLFKLVSIGVLSAIILSLGVYCRNKSYQLVPNPAYSASIIDTLKILLVFILSVLFLSSKFNFKALSGILFSIVGIYILITNQ